MAQLGRNQARHPQNSVCGSISSLALACEAGLMPTCGSLDAHSSPVNAPSSPVNAPMQLQHQARVRLAPTLRLGGFVGSVLSSAIV